MSIKLTRRSQLNILNNDYNSYGEKEIIKEVYPDAPDSLTVESLPYSTSGYINQQCITYLVYLKKGMEKLYRHIETEEKYQPVNLCFDTVTTHQEWNEAPWLHDRWQVTIPVIVNKNTRGEYHELDVFLCCKYYGIPKKHIDGFTVIVYNEVAGLDEYSHYFKHPRYGKGCDWDYYQKTMTRWGNTEKFCYDLGGRCDRLYGWDLLIEVNRMLMANELQHIPWDQEDKLDEFITETGWVDEDYNRLHYDFEDEYKISRKMYPVFPNLYDENGKSYSANRIELLSPDKWKEEYE